VVDVDWLSHELTVVVECLLVSVVVAVEVDITLVDTAEAALRGVRFG